LQFCVFAILLFCIFAFRLRIGRTKKGFCYLHFCSRSTCRTSLVYIIILDCLLIDHRPERNTMNTRYTADEVKSHLSHFRDREWRCFQKEAVQWAMASTKKFRIIKEDQMKKIPAALSYLPTYTCLRCSHEWHPRTNETPTVCPKCKSPYWNVPRKISKAV